MFVINQWNVHPETRDRLVVARFYDDPSWYPGNLLSNLVKLRQMEIKNLSRYKII